MTSPGSKCALEKRLAEDLEKAGYEVMNVVTATAAGHEELYGLVRQALEAHFLNL